MPFEFNASVVPPTAVTSGSEAGKSGSGCGAPSVDVVAEVTGREVEADAFGSGLDEHRVLDGDLVAKAVLAKEAVRVADDVGDVVLDDVVHRVVDAGVAVRGADVVDVGARCHAVNGLDVERLLLVPAGFAAALVLEVNGVNVGLA